MTIVSQQLLDSFMDSYSELHSIMEWVWTRTNCEIQLTKTPWLLCVWIFSDTNDELAALPNNSCVDGIRNRWTIQVHRHGQILGECLWNSYQELSAWNNRLNSLHDEYQISLAGVQNLGVRTMTYFDDFTGTQDISVPINRQFRNLLGRALPYLQEYEEFRASVVDNEDQIIDQLTMCDRNIAAAFEIEARADLARARNCVA